jgi:hypothetical protein
VKAQKSASWPSRVGLRWSKVSGYIDLIRPWSTRHEFRWARVTACMWFGSPSVAVAEEIRGTSALSNRHATSQGFWTELTRYGFGGQDTSKVSREANCAGLHEGWVAVAVVGGGRVKARWKTSPLESTLNNRRSMSYIAARLPKDDHSFQPCVNRDHGVLLRVCKGHNSPRLNTY